MEGAIDLIKSLEGLRRCPNPAPYALIAWFSDDNWKLEISLSIE